MFHRSGSLPWGSGFGCLEECKVWRNAPESARRLAVWGLDHEIPSIFQLEPGNTKTAQKRAKQAAGSPKRVSAIVAPVWRVEPTTSWQLHLGRVSSSVAVCRGTQLFLGIQPAGAPNGAKTPECERQNWVGFGMAHDASCAIGNAQQVGPSHCLQRDAHGG